MGILMTVPAISAASEADFLRCRGIADPKARLACYDALPVPTSPPASTAPRRPAASETPAPRQTPEQFGLEQRQQQQAAAAELSAIETHIPGRFEGWHPRKAIRLANGQVWQIADDSSSVIVRESPKVKIRRGMLGAFYLDIEGDNRSPRVRRIQ